MAQPGCGRSGGANECLLLVAIGTIPLLVLEFVKVVRTRGRKPLEPEIV